MLDIRQFLTWFTPVTWNTDDPEILSIRLCIAEYLNGHKTEGELRACLNAVTGKMASAWRHLAEQWADSSWSILTRLGVCESVHDLAATGVIDWQIEALMHAQMSCERPTILSEGYWWPLGDRQPRADFCNRLADICTKLGSGQ